MVKFYVIRHGNKDGDRLTELGQAQIMASVELIKKEHNDISHVYHSKTERTQQCALLAALLLGRPFGMTAEADGLSVDKPFINSLGGDMDKFEQEHKIIMSTGNNVGNALHQGIYPFSARLHLGCFLLETAAKMEIQDEHCCIGFSHSPFCSLAVPDYQAETMPYDIGEADIIAYTIEDGIITDAKRIPCPYKG